MYDVPEKDCIMSENKGIGWMYEGAKSLVNREDYLLGKKIGKDFEKYSDVVNDLKPEAFDALMHTRTVTKPQPSAVKTSALETYVVATEDPLVAVKVKEETRRREVLENPLMKLKFQKMLKEMMAAKEGKVEKKKKKKKKKKNKKAKKAVDEEEGGTIKKDKKRMKSCDSSEEQFSTHSSLKTKSHSQKERHNSSSQVEKGSQHSRELKPEKIFEETGGLQRRSRSPAMSRKRKSHHDSSRSTSNTNSRNRETVHGSDQKRRRRESSSGSESSVRRSSRSKVQKRRERKSSSSSESSDRRPSRTKVRKRSKQKSSSSSESSVRNPSEVQKRNKRKSSSSSDSSVRRSSRSEVRKRSRRRPSSSRGSSVRRPSRSGAQKRSREELSSDHDILLRREKRYNDASTASTTIERGRTSTARTRSSRESKTSYCERSRSSSPKQKSLKSSKRKNSNSSVDSSRRSRSPFGRGEHSLATSSPSTSACTSRSELVKNMQKDHLMKEINQDCDLDFKSLNDNEKSEVDKGRLSKNGSPCEDDNKESQPLRLFDTHIPEHLRPKGLATNSDDDEDDISDQEESEHKKRFMGFGLVGAKKKDELPNTAENPYELSRRPVPSVYKKPESHGPLTEEEKQKRLKEMAENAKWRQEVRKSNIKVASMKEDKEAEEDMSDKAPSFLRSQLNTAAADLTVEQRLQSKKKSLQRSHGYMEQKFTSK
ncbi:hypothetical protein KIN20_036289 [Parelaphostrongylus tenuis]|uniref:Uncharacterized protein n=1 Tax=Parelaphostrongylus tenuis TaxID=148309 RepID=A0AAD5RCT4_PARTN|nr:hypothetical protein KIN20_036289 [Parelaphostrongylus tenuis]